MRDCPICAEFIRKVDEAEDEEIQGLFDNFEHDPYREPTVVESGPVKLHRATGVQYGNNNSQVNTFGPGCCG